jgi:hypothetical protein
MLSYDISDAGTFPRLRCDVCHKPINDPNGFAHSSESGEIAFAHAGACDRKLEHTPASFLGSESLGAFFFYLLRNTRIGRKELEEAAHRDDVLGVVASRKKLERVR